MKTEIAKKEKAPKPKYNMAQNSWFMIKLAWTSGEKKVIILALLTSLLAVASNLVNLYISPTILSAVERHVGIGELMLTIFGFTSAMMLLAAANSYVGSNVLYGRISVRTEIIKLMQHKVQVTSYPNLFDEKFKKLSSKASDSTSANDRATEAIWTTLSSLLTNLIGFTIYVVMLTNVQPILIAVILATSLTSYFISNYLSGYEHRHRDEAAELYKHVNYMNDSMRDFSMAKDIRIFGLRPWLDELYDKAKNANIAFLRKSHGINFWGSIADLVMSFLRNGAAYAYLIGLVLNGRLSVPEFLLFFSAVGGFSGWLTGILNNMNTLHRQSLELSTLRECLEYPEPFRFEDGEHIKAEPDRKYEIKLENVTFRYPGAENDTLRNINLTIHPGEKLAVVGLNGAGKTTLVKLISGFLDPTEGRVLLDGKDIREYNRTDYYTLFSAVFQDFSLLAGTIAVNVAQNEDDIDMERVKDCVEKAGLTKKVESLPDKYDTKLNREVYNDAVALSGGETQRLMLARALYKNAPFIILDEPTAALDPIAESDMYRKYNAMSNGRSSVYISHRLASTRFCDRIILIENAVICEEGTHDELMKRGGKYAELFGVQSKYYKEEKSDEER